MSDGEVMLTTGLKSNEWTPRERQSELFTVGGTGPVVELGDPYWEAQFTYENMTDAEWRALTAWVARRRGAKSYFRGFHAARRNPASGAPGSVEVVELSGKRLKVLSNPPLQVGDMLAYDSAGGGRFVGMVTEVVSAGAVFSIVKTFPSIVPPAETPNPDVADPSGEFRILPETVRMSDPYDPKKRLAFTARQKEPVVGSSALSSTLATLLASINASSNAAFYNPSDTTSLFVGTDGSGGNCVPVAHGGELLSNGRFVSGLDGWTVFGGEGASLALVSGKARLTSGASRGRASHAVTCEVGKRYSVRLNRELGTATSLNSAQLKAASSPGFGWALNISSTDANPLAGEFIADATTMYITFQVEEGAKYMDFDDVSVVETGDLVGNGDFDSDTGWALTSEIEITGGKLQLIAGSGGEGAFYDLGAPGGTVEVTFTIDSIASSNVQVQACDDENGSNLVASPINVSAAGTYTASIDMSGGQQGFRLRVQNAGGASCVIDSVRAVRPENKVGLMLDTAQMGGLTAAEFIEAQPELILESGWTFTGSNFTQDGRAFIVDNASGSERATYTGAVTPGETYVIDLSWKNQTSGGITIHMEEFNSIGFRSSLEPGTSGSVRLIAQAVAGNGKIAVRADGTTVGEYTVSLKHVPGFHAVAPSDAARPTLKQDAQGRYYLETDGVDDRMDASPVFTGAASATFMFGVSTPGPKGVMLSQGGSTRFVFAINDGAPGAASSSAGSPTYRVDGADVSLADQNASHDAVADESAHVVTVEAITFTSWTAYSLFDFSSVSGLNWDGNFYGGIILQDDLTAAERANAERLIADLTGVTLA